MSATFPTEPRFFTSWDGTRLAWREVGPESKSARPAVLLHGFFSDGWTNWMRYGHAAALVARGFRVIVPYVRGYGPTRFRSPETPRSGQPEGPQE